MFELVTEWGQTETGTRVPASLLSDVCVYAARLRSKNDLTTCCSTVALSRQCESLISTEALDEVCNRWSPRPINTCQTQQLNATETQHSSPYNRVNDWAVYRPIDNKQRSSLSPQRPSTLVCWKVDEKHSLSPCDDERKHLSRSTCWYWKYSCINSCW